MDTLLKAVLGVIIFCSMWTGSAGKIAYTVEKLSPTGSPCQLELRCAIQGQATKFHWYRGSTKISDDSRHRVEFGGEQLTVTPDSNTNSAVYKCLSEATQEDLSVDVAPACNFIGSSCMCSRVRMAMTITFLCLWFSALGFTAYFCCGQTSQKKAGKKGHTTAKDNEEGIYSPVGIADTGNKGSAQDEEMPGPSSTEGDLDTNYQALNKEKVSNYSMITPTAAKADPQDPRYQALGKDTEEDYSAISPQASEGEPVVTFSALNKEVTIELLLPDGANGQE
ncbi:uncharacterized protein LOC129708737 isoform X2 [Leucoraja erinacea]|uniref:uncharacterized protein LOC129708737 isoform X2 n=1 Tax=Leucoraja erinaceus TaxID=7782 RepID=UPI00245809D0|nr:uncharacterized protein LOC129708737 isoform X2 [Leucoraja erinacea]